MHFTLGISNISEATCDRKLIIYIISRLKKEFIPEEENPNVYMRIGKILHTILQITFKRIFSHIEFYYYRLNKSLEESIRLAFGFVLDYWKYLLKIYLKSNILEKSEYAELIDNINMQLPILVEHAKSLIYVRNNFLENSVIDDEFNVTYQIIPGVLLTGKIDLVCFNQKDYNFYFIELKTGKPSPTKHNRQLRLYKEIFNEKQAKDINLELWNTKPGSPQRGFQKIKRLRKYKDSELSKIKSKIIEAINCKNIEDLPSIIDFPSSEKICMFCEYCNHLKVIFKADSKKKNRSIFDFYNL